jgi:hypothetical protein
MREAAGRLDADNREGARENQEDALAELNRAAEELEEERQDLEERKREEIARVVVGRLYSMLAEQELISTETQRVHKLRPPAPLPRPSDRSASVGGADAPPAETPPAETPPAETPPTASATREPPLSADAYAAEGRSLARRERGLHTDAGGVLRILAEDESAVVAPEILRRVQDDLENVARRLEGAGLEVEDAEANIQSIDTGELVQLLQRDVATALRELIQALQPPRRPRPQGAGGGGGGGGGSGAGGQGDRRRQLITPVMEIRMLLSAQRRVRERTARCHALGLLAPEKSARGAAGDGAGTDPFGASTEATGAGATGSVEALRGEQVERIARAQEALAGLAEELIRKYPVIDQFLLGLDNDAITPQDASEGESSGAEEADSEGGGTNGDSVNEGR